MHENRIIHRTKIVVVPVWVLEGGGGCMRAVYKTMDKYMV